MRITRRRFFVGSALGWVLSRLLPAHAAPISDAAPATPLATVETVLRAYVDVLIPADETPSGSELGVDRQLLTVANGQRDYQFLLRSGLAWLDRQALVTYGRGFPDLNEVEREAVVRQAALADHKTLARVFFERTRADAFFHYYGRAESWRGIRNYRGAPQPLGYMDYAQPPRSTR